MHPGSTTLAGAPHSSAPQAFIQIVQKLPKITSLGGLGEKKLKTVVHKSLQNN